MSRDATDGGLYVIAFSVGQAQKMTVGRLGEVEFAPGLYLYTGSARRGLAARITRHKATGKRLRWHVDYLREVTDWRWAVYFPLGHMGECGLARRAIMEVKGAVAHPRFGASDCRCPGHLARTDLSPVAALDAMMGAGGKPWKDGGAVAVRTGRISPIPKKAKKRC